MKKIWPCPLVFVTPFIRDRFVPGYAIHVAIDRTCLLYTSDAADE